MADTYTINYEDPRFGKVEADKQQAMTELDETYSGMISESDKYYQDQIDATKEWANTQQQLQRGVTMSSQQEAEQHLAILITESNENRTQKEKEAAASASATASPSASASPSATASASATNGASASASPSASASGQGAAQ